MSRSTSITWPGTGSRRSMRPSQRWRIPIMKTTKSSPLARTSSLGSQTRQKHLRYLAMLLPALGVGKPPQVAQAVLKAAQQEGLPWDQLYQEAVDSRPEGWPPAPPLELVAPEGSLRPPPQEGPSVTSPAPRSRGGSR